MERIGQDMDDLRKKMETFIKNNGRLNEQNPKTEAEEAAEERKKCLTPIPNLNGKYKVT